MRHYPLVLWQEDPCLEAYCASLQVKTFRNRAFYARAEEQVSTVSAKMVSMLPELEAQIKSLRLAIRSIDTGMPATDSIEPPKAIEELDPGQKALVKAAFKKAAGIAHPDKGGTDADFAYILAAYRANDLNVLTEYVLTYGEQKPVAARISYWSDALHGARARWLKRQMTDEYRLVMRFMRGKQEQALGELKSVLQYVIVTLNDELHTKLAKSKANAK